MTGLAAVILAAGKGKRMQSDLPKVLHEAADAPMVRWVVDAARRAGVGRVVLVVGHGQELVRAAFAEDDPDAAPIEFAVQDRQLGTGHAVRCAEPHLEGFEGDVIVLCGDGPLIRSETIETLVDTHHREGGEATLATARVPDPAGYGRIVRDASGAFVGIVEEKNATTDQKAINEINPSYYCFRGGALFEALRRVERNEATGEYYLTDVPSMLLADGAKVSVIDAVPADEVHSVNTPEQLAQVDALLRQRLAGATGGRG